MSNAWTVMLRAPCTGLRTSLIRPARQFQRAPFAKQQFGLDVRIRFLSCTATRPAKVRIPEKRKKEVNGGSAKGPAATPKAPRKPAVVIEPVETLDEELLWDPLSAEDIKGIFGDNVSQSDGNGVLYELHDRRLSGSLSEYGISFQESVGVTEAQAMAGLEWLRQEYPIDEAGAALEYAERAASGLQGEQLEQAVKWRLYKEAQPGESVYGHSVVQEKAKEWQENYKEKQRQKEILREEKRKEWEMRTAEVRKNVQEKRLAIGQQHIELEVQREEKYKYWEEMKKAAELPSDQILAKRSAFSRLLAPTLFGFSVLIVAAVLSDPASLQPPRGLTPDSWKLPSTADITPSMVTCAAITAINLIVYIAWKNPHAWKAMNRYFLLSAGVPNPFSVLGSVFSHQFWTTHLVQNTIFLFLVGMPLHDEVGRLNFIAIYLSAGVFGSLTSLYWNVLRRKFLIATIGASGATAGLLGAYFTVRPERDLYVPFTSIAIQYDSWYAIAGFAALELFTILRSGGKMFDHPAHIGGLVAGMIAGMGLRKNTPEATPPPPHEYVATVTELGPGPGAGLKGDEG